MLLRTPFIFIRGIDIPWWSSRSVWEKAIEGFGVHRRWGRSELEVWSAEVSPKGVVREGGREREITCEWDRGEIVQYHINHWFQWMRLGKNLRQKLCERIRLHLCQNDVRRIYDMLRPTHQDFLTRKFVEFLHLKGYFGDIKCSKKRVIWHNWLIVFSLGNFFGGLF